jgi:hypothetical protein
MDNDPMIAWGTKIVEESGRRRPTHARRAEVGISIKMKSAHDQ